MPPASRSWRRDSAEFWGLMYYACKAHVNGQMVSVQVVLA
jgi:hypothetical protein